ncbi:SseB family protein [Actinomadura craniellae]|uniref:SseB family protein n=1 Tax=Actinomadura craniellae TaxID=2231787 RepID=UPI0011BE5BD9|nr:SseB family protein [Actinomadura craniellae]
MADAWQPASDLERRMLDALQSGDQEAYFRLLSQSELILPVAADAVAGVLSGRIPLTWPTREEGGRTHVLAFTSPEAMRLSLGPAQEHFVTLRFTELATGWPELRWWLAIDMELLLQGLLPGWFVQQIAAGDTQPPQAGRAGMPGAAPGGALIGEPAPRGRRARRARPPEPAPPPTAPGPAPGRDAAAEPAPGPGLPGSGDPLAPTTPGVPPAEGPRPTAPAAPLVPSASLHDRAPLPVPGEAQAALRTTRPAEAPMAGPAPADVPPVAGPGIPDGPRRTAPEAHPRTDGSAALPGPLPDAPHPPAPPVESTAAGHAGERAIPAPRPGGSPQPGRHDRPSPGAPARADGPAAQGGSRPAGSEAVATAAVPGLTGTRDLAAPTPRPPLPEPPTPRAEPGAPGDRNATAPGLPAAPATTLGATPPPGPTAPSDTAAPPGPAAPSGPTTPSGATAPSGVGAPSGGATPSGGTAPSGVGATPPGGTVAPGATPLDGPVRPGDGSTVPSPAPGTPAAAGGLVPPVGGPETSTGGTPVPDLPVRPGGTGARSSGGHALPGGGTEQPAAGASAGPHLPGGSGAVPAEPAVPGAPPLRDSDTAGRTPAGGPAAAPHRSPAPGSPEPGTAAPAGPEHTAPAPGGAGAAVPVPPAPGAPSGPAAPPHGPATPGRPGSPAADSGLPLPDVPPHGPAAQDRPDLPPPPGPAPQGAAGALAPPAGSDAPSRPGGAAPAGPSPATPARPGDPAPAGRGAPGSTGPAGEGAAAELNGLLPPGVAAPTSPNGLAAAPGPRPTGRGPVPEPDRAAGEQGGGEEPAGTAGEVERRLAEAAVLDDLETAFGLLADIEVLIPIPPETDYAVRPGRPNFPWMTAEMDDVVVLPLFTSPERLREAIGSNDFLAFPLSTVVRYWPDPRWTPVINPGAESELSLPGDELSQLAAWAEQRVADQLAERFEPQNEIEQRLLDASARHDTVAFFDVLRTAQVLVPTEPETPWGIRPDDADFPWRPVPLQGRLSIQVFTSPRWMHEAIGPSRFVMPAFLDAVASWPDRSWALAINPGTPIGMTVPGDQVSALTGAAEAAPADRPADRPAHKPAADRPADRPAAAARPAEEPAAGEPDFEPGNRIDQELYEAALSGDTDAFLQVLFAANVLVPIPADAPLEVMPTQPEFRWDAALRDSSSVQVFTSLVRLREVLPASRFVYADFRELIGTWPRTDWAMLLNPGTRIGASLGGDQVRALSEWAVRVGLTPAAEPAVHPGGVPTHRPAGSVPEPRPADPGGEPAPPPTVMQKVLPHEHVSWYLEQAYDRVGGFVHPVAEVTDLHTPAQLYAALGLLYEGSPFSSDDEGVYVIRWPAYCPDLYRIPFGGRSEEELAGWGDAGWVIERPPFQGSGFAPGSAGSIREYKVDSARLPYGAEMYHLSRDRSERYVAMYDPDRLVWVRADDDAQDAR